MLMHLYNIIRNEFDLSVVDVSINAGNNRLEISVFNSLFFYLHIYKRDFEVYMVVENGTISSIIGGREIRAAASDDAIITAIEYIIEYSRLRLGLKYFDAGVRQ